MNQYLIAANTKKGQLIFNIFRPIDLIIAVSGVILTFILMIIFQPNQLLEAIIVLFPFMVCAFLVIPIPNYHNVLCILQNIHNFYKTNVFNNELVWKGWCASDEYGEK